MQTTNEILPKRKHVVFLSSSVVNLAKLLALNTKEYDVFLILDRRIPFDIEDEELDNFYLFTFNKNKVFENNREKYFDNLGIYLTQFEPDIIVTNNFTKIIPQSFIDFVKFKFSNAHIINIHHGDLSIFENNEMKYSGMQGGLRELVDLQTLTTTIHEIEDEGVDTGKQHLVSYPTSIKELRQKHLLNKNEDLINYRIRNVVKSYHERTKVLNNLLKVLKELL